MKVNGSFSQQLILNETALVPGGEWTPRLPGWSFLYLAKGVGYWLHPRANCELSPGTTLVLSESAAGVIRCSQVGEMLVRHFSVQPQKLAGVVTLSEQRSLEEAARKETFAARVFPAGEAVAEKFGRLCQRRPDSALRLRLQMLELFTLVFEQDLAPKCSEETADNGAKARLEGLLKQMHPVDMLELNFRELAAQVGCCPRHLGRVFEQAVGMTFREKQAQVRLGRAQELLATTNSKVVEVALESGYQSLSLFNFMFKKRFGVTPAQWRERPYRRSEIRLQAR